VGGKPTASGRHPRLFSFHSMIIRRGQGMDFGSIFSPVLHKAHRTLFAQRVSRDSVGHAVCRGWGASPYAVGRKQPTCGRRFGERDVRRLLAAGHLALLLHLTARGATEAVSPGGWHTTHTRAPGAWCPTG
jgi:hypothetical protein